MARSDSESALNGGKNTLNTVLTGVADDMNTINKPGWDFSTQDYCGAAETGIADMVLTALEGICFETSGAGCAIAEITGYSSFNHVKTAPEAGYRSKMRISSNRMYAVKTREGRYAVICVTSITQDRTGVRCSFLWKYQADGTNSFLQ